MQLHNSLEHLSDNELLAATQRAARESNGATAVLLAHLAELDRRKLYLAKAKPSLFQYAVDVLGLSESAAYMRITAARVAQKYPQVLPLVASGALHLTAIKMMAPHLSDENHAELFATLSHKNRQAIELELGRRFARPDVPQVLRKLPVAKTAPAQPPTTKTSAAPPPAPANSFWNELRLKASPPPTTKTEPLSPRRYKLQLTLCEEAQAKLKQAQDLLRHRIPDGDLAQVLERALDALLEKEMKQKLGTTDRPRQVKDTNGRTRHIPNSVRREVLERDGQQCAFVSQEGERCPATGGLELHHVHPYAKGGEHTSANVKLYCKAHNTYAAEHDYGRARMARYKARRQRPSEVREPRAAYVATTSAMQAANGIQPGWLISNQSAELRAFGTRRQRRIAAPADIMSVVAHRRVALPASGAAGSMGPRRPHAARRGCLSALTRLNRHSVSFKMELVVRLATCLGASSQDAAAAARRSRARQRPKRSRARERAACRCGARTPRLDRGPGGEQGASTLPTC